jgi:hypothetical protein
MSDELSEHFDSIESAQEFVELLGQAIEEAKTEIQAQITAATAAADPRWEQALHLVAYKLGNLAQHMATSRRILNDLRTLRRLLLEERQPTTRASAQGGP